LILHTPNKSLSKWASILQQKIYIQKLGMEHLELSRYAYNIVLHILRDQFSGILSISFSECILAVHALVTTWPI